MAEKYYVEVDDDGTYWFTESGAGRKLHRLDGPAAENVDGSRQWFQNGLLHRTDGPAVEYADGSREWFQNDVLHRLDGPAIVNAAGTREWWINGVQHTEAAWRAATQPVVEMTVAEIEAVLGRRIKIVK